jgi:hypothetical protein
MVASLVEVIDFAMLCRLPVRAMNPVCAAMKRRPMGGTAVKGGSGVREPGGIV